MIGIKLEIKEGLEKTISSTNLKCDFEDPFDHDEEITREHLRT